jgi:uncharacterized protein (TIGR02594 family)
MATYRQPWMNTAYSKLGLEESPGSKNNPEIMKWAKETELTKDFTADSVPWCGLFVAWAFARNGIDFVKDPLWAQNWNKFGDKLSEPAFGCVMVFVRKGGGHVGFYVGEDSQNYHILGGNQTDSVSVTKVAKNRCIGYRWPTNYGKFLVKGRIRKQMAGSISKNEA